MISDDPVSMQTHSWLIMSSKLLRVRSNLLLFNISLFFNQRAKVATWPQKSNTKLDYNFSLKRVHFGIWSFARVFLATLSRNVNLAQINCDANLSLIVFFAQLTRQVPVLAARWRQLAAKHQIQADSKVSNAQLSRRIKVSPSDASGCKLNAGRLYGPTKLERHNSRKTNGSDKSIVLSEHLRRWIDDTSIEFINIRSIASVLFALADQSRSLSALAAELKLCNRDLLNQWSGTKLEKKLEHGLWIWNERETHRLMLMSLTTIVRSKRGKWREHCATLGRRWSKMSPSKSNCLVRSHWIWNLKSWDVLSFEMMRTKSWHKTKMAKLHHQENNEIDNETQFL